MSLTKEQLAARDGKLTASRVACLMSGDKDKILNLWYELIGSPLYVEENLDDVWAVQLGSATEQLQLDWFERKYGKASRRGEVVIYNDFACTLDGWSDVHECPIECKHVGGFEKSDIVLARYMPQMHWQMFLTRTKLCAFSVIRGASEPTVDFIQKDGPYMTELVHRAAEFMKCVYELREPVEVSQVAPPIQVNKEYDMTQSNIWSNFEAIWLENKVASGKFNEAADELKGLLPSDGKRAFGKQLEAKRDRAGRVKILRRI